MSSKATMQHWYRQQVDKMTPGEQQARKEAAEKKAKVVEYKEKAKKMRSRAAKTSAGMKGALQQMQRGFGLTSESSVVDEVKNCWGQAECYNDEAETESCYALCKEGESEAAAIAREEGEEGAKDFELLLSDLKVEPKSESAVQAKFSLFEAYLSTVEKLRSDLFDFWEECKETIPDGPVRTDICKQLIAVDDRRNTGLPDFSPVRWFVYDMTKKAQQNNTLMSKLLKSIETKLTLISDSSSDCPFCLEDFSPDHPSHLLTCCHRVGLSCWKVWTDVRGPSAPCPVCRHSDFLNYIEAQQ